MKDVLPFSEELTWERFQLFCTDVLYKHYGSVDSRDYLRMGNKQDGIDIYAVPSESEKLNVAQCKLEKYLSPKRVTDLVQEFISGEFITLTRVFILCTSADLKRHRDEKETIRKARELLEPFGVQFIVWDQSGLSKELRTNATPDIVNIVYRYFGEHHTRQFYGGIWEKFLKKLNPVRKRAYDIPADFIERHLVKYGKVDAIHPFDLYRNDRDKVTLTRLFEKPDSPDRHVILLSSAGFGKSLALQQVAGYFSADEKVIYPVRFSLVNYLGSVDRKYPRFL